MSPSPQAPPPPPPPPPPRRPTPGGRQGGKGGWGRWSNSNQSSDSQGKSQSRMPRWTIWVLIGALVAVLVFPMLAPSDDSEHIEFHEFREQVEDGEIATVEYNNNNGDITGEYVDEERGEFRSTGPMPLSDEDRELIQANTELNFDTPEPNPLWQFLPYVFFFGLIVLFWVWMLRRAQGQMGGVMSVGRSKAKTYDTERPGTKFADVAGYEGVKQEVTEVIDFLKTPQKFGEIGARIPKGILLVGPPGTGKTLIARAVAGEAGVPFLSVTGSDFMEMFVGVGASRVRDLFDSARKMGRAIIFIDELDSIGRKRGAGLGGGHDEREQTLNQMLAEMDGFEPSEGIVMMAATNRPDILDPALLRPGRFDRQVVVPLPSLEDRIAILGVHVRHKRMGPDVDLEVIARGTPGMSGADLANLVNEAALFAVRSGEDAIHKDHFDAARDRILMGQKRDTLALSDQEKEAISYHEGGHAVCAAVLPHADPVHKVSIIPTGAALGVTQQLPEAERHLYRQDYIEESLVVRMGGRVAEELVYGIASTGANNDLVGSTELARKMVREWGMSERVGPMAWGSQGEVFLGEDLMHTRDYSDDTARVIDEEVERILREQENRCREILRENRAGLDLVAKALIEHETIDGDEVIRLIKVGRGEIADDGTSRSAEARDVVERSRANGGGDDDTPDAIADDDAGDDTDVADEVAQAESRP
ncbi:MAG: ATP-dependent zinc metalloprotease FtsH [Acidimicrobiales bacterium]|nr:ATP-dependent zinc metalloprotease FtsH [Acidimicrobiales bacterium]